MVGGEPRHGVRGHPRHRQPSAVQAGNMSAPAVGRVPAQAADVPFATGMTCVVHAEVLNMGHMCLLPLPVLALAVLLGRATR